jgi:hypothetical protein
MTGRFVPPDNTPDRTEILEAVEGAVRDDPYVRDLPPEEVARQLVLGGYLQEEPPVSLVADALGTIGAEEQAFGPDVPLEEV